MATRSYKLYYSGTGNTDNVANLKILRPGQLVSIRWNAVGKGGAAVDGQYRWELSKQSSSQFSVNDTNWLVLDSHGYSNNISGGGTSASKVSAGMSKPLVVGDTIYLHQSQAGTAFVTSVIECFLEVSE